MNWLSPRWWNERALTIYETGGWEWYAPRWYPVVIVIVYGALGVTTGALLIL